MTSTTSATQRLPGQPTMAFVTLRASRGLLLAGAALILQSTTVLAAGDIEHGPSGEPKLLFGDLGGLRDTLGSVGIGFGLDYIGETFASVTGGIKRGAVYD